MHLCLLISTLALQLSKIHVSIDINTLPVHLMCSFWKESLSDCGARTSLRRFRFFITEEEDWCFKLLQTSNPVHLCFQRSSDDGGVDSFFTSTSPTSATSTGGGEVRLPASSLLSSTGDGDSPDVSQPASSEKPAAVTNGLFLLATFCVIMVLIKIGVFVWFRDLSEFGNVFWQKFFCNFLMHILYVCDTTVFAKVVGFSFYERKMFYIWPAAKCVFEWCCVLEDISLAG